MINSCSFSFSCILNVELEGGNVTLCMTKLDKTVFDYINQNNLIGIKAGRNRDRFLDIWMVTVGNRIFARSWGLAEKSWYHTFLNDQNGEIRCGETIIKIKAVVPTDITELNEKISEAYLKKYDRGENSFYARGIIKDEHIARTMEFIPRD